MAIPKGDKESRQSQIKLLAESNGVEPEYQLPEIGEAEYLVSALSEIGEGKISGERLTSIDWIDIQAWIEITGAEISAGEAEAIKELSVTYISQYYEATEKGCPSPNIERPKTKEAIAGKIKNMFALLRG